MGDAPEAARAGAATACDGCGARSRDGAPWCPSCFGPSPDPRFRYRRELTSAPRIDDLAPPRPTPLRDLEHSRWIVSEVTFGPVGRLVLTLLLLSVAPLFLVLSPAGGWIAALMWLVVFVPPALRDVWRRVRRGPR